ncbi:MAG: hypothetical protein PHW07_03790 [Sulfurospirillaceae bacterium]|nr:hypothetical protein [Sulfurospirillaceae bacterium]
MKYLLLITLLCLNLFAHKLYIIADDDGENITIKSYFTRSSFCQECDVIVEDTNQNTLGTYKTDANGIAIFPLSNNKVNITVSASMGHQNKIEYESTSSLLPSSEKNTKTSEEFSFFKIVFSLLVLIAIFGVLYILKRKK